MSALTIAGIAFAVIVVAAAVLLVAGLCYTAKMADISAEIDP